MIKENEGIRQKMKDDSNRELAAKDEEMSMLAKYLKEIERYNQFL